MPILEAVTDTMTSVKDIIGWLNTSVLVVVAVFVLTCKSGDVTTGAWMETGFCQRSPFVTCKLIIHFIVSVKFSKKKNK